VPRDLRQLQLGQTANNPTKEGASAVYDGVLVPAIVKDDYLYQSPDTAGTEVLMRFAGLNPGTYNVTVFEGRTTDGNGRFGKVWVDDINGKKEPAAQNTGNYSGVNLDVNGVPTPVGQPRTVTVEIKAGEYLWFAEMEDNSGGISGMIIRGLSSTGSTAPPRKLGFARSGSNLILSWEGAATLESADEATGPWSAVTGATSPRTVAPSGTRKFYRLKL